MKQLIVLVFAFSIVGCVSEKERLEEKEFINAPWPDMVGVPPDKSVKSWVKLDLIGTMDHPFPFIWFSPQEFEREYPNVLIKLEDDGYEQFKVFVRANQCETNLNNVHGDPLLRVTEYADDQQIVRCILPPEKACDYTNKVIALSTITWTETQMDIMQRMANDFSCDLMKK